MMMVVVPVMVAAMTVSVTGVIVVMLVGRGRLAHWAAPG
jgi:hypothetical protein